MKVALGQHIHAGPWGGGNRFAAMLAGALKDRGDQVVFDLDHDDIDLILLTDPRPRNPLVAFTPGDVLRHLARDPRPIVVHRINECDERKGTLTLNTRLRLANYAADHTVFIATWLKELAVWRRESPFSILMNGADPTIFYPRPDIQWRKGEPLRLVTHHWGGHANKGFDVYTLLDEWLSDPAFARRFTFTYIGNLPQGLTFKNVRHLTPLDGRPLAQELGRHHAYVTGSINEPAGMHHIEGALCGLPLLFRNSGALPEYCRGFGEEFDSPADFRTALDRLEANYDQLKRAMARYTHTSKHMFDGYLALFDQLVVDADAIRSRRRLWRSPLAFLFSQILIA